jgi:CBS domain-containing protein
VQRVVAKKRSARRMASMVASGTHTAPSPPGAGQAPAAKERRPAVHVVAVTDDEQAAVLLERAGGDAAQDAVLLDALDRGLSVGDGVAGARQGRSAWPARDRWPVSASGWRRMLTTEACASCWTEEARTMTATTSPPDATLRELLGTVGDAMTCKLVLLDADTPADSAARRLERAGVSGAPVVDRGRVVGVATLRDLLTPLAPLAPTTGPFLRHEHHLAGIRVRELMTNEPATARSDWPLARAVLLLDEAGINRLPVVDPSGRPVGILTRDDVLRAIARHLRPGQPTVPGGSIMEAD